MAERNSLNPLALTIKAVKTSHFYSLDRINTWALQNGFRDYELCALTGSGQWVYIFAQGQNVVVLLNLFLLPCCLHPTQKCILQFSWSFVKYVFNLVFQGTFSAISKGNFTFRPTNNTLRNSLAEHINASLQNNGHAKCIFGGPTQQVWVILYLTFCSNIYLHGHSIIQRAFDAENRFGMPIVFEEVFYERFQFTLHTNVHPYTHPGNLHLSCIKVPKPCD